MKAARQHKGQANSRWQHNARCRTRNMHPHAHNAALPHFTQCECAELTAESTHTHTPGWLRSYCLAFCCACCTSMNLSCCCVPTAMGRGEHARQQRVGGRSQHHELRLSACRLRHVRACVHCSAALAYSRQAHINSVTLTCFSSEVICPPGALGLPWSLPRLSSSGRSDGFWGASCVSLAAISRVGPVSPSTCVCVCVVVVFQTPKFGDDGVSGGPFTQSVERMSAHAMHVWCAAVHLS